MMNDGPIAGVAVTRTPIFTALATEHDWPRRLLVAMESAKALGVPRFEIEAEPAVNEVPVTKAVQPANGWGFTTYERVGTREEPTQRITLYALRVE